MDLEFLTDERIDEILEENDIILDNDLDFESDDLTDVPDFYHGILGLHENVKVDLSIGIQFSELGINDNCCEQLPF